MSENSTIYQRSKQTSNGRGKLLQAGRRITAFVALSVMVLFFVLLGTSAALKLKWIADIQIVPMALTVSGSLILFWVLVTMLFGRIYCSMVCPLGILQDFSSRLPRMTRKRKFRYGFRYHEGHNKFRYTWLALIVLSSIAGLSILLTLFDPYGAFGRFMSYLLRPLITIAKGEVVLDGILIGLAIAAVTLVAVIAVSFKRGRLICNTVCPVGSALSLISRHSVFGMDINTDVCVSCGLCERVCKAECIDGKAHTVDMSRCVVCFNCTAVCDHSAITYTRRRHRLSIPMLMKVQGPQTAATFDASRRKFIVAGIALAASPILLKAEKTLDKLPQKEEKPRTRDKQVPTTGTRPVTPPGIASTRSFLTKCVGCGACITACPAQVLHPSTNQYGISGALHPVKNYDESYCLFDCVKCTEVCPTGALEKLTVMEKHNFSVGLAIVDMEACIGCGKCARSCPKETITMEKIDGKRKAIVHHQNCIGCGECQYVCPAFPNKAIKVNGLQR